MHPHVLLNLLYKFVKQKEARLCQTSYCFAKEFYNFNNTEE